MKNIRGERLTLLKDRLSIGTRRLLVAFGEFMMTPMTETHLNREIESGQRMSEAERRLNQESGRK